jgi:hypothetical protein
VVDDVENVFHFSYCVDPQRVIAWNAIIHKLYIKGRLLPLELSFDTQRYARVLRGN